MHSLVYHEPDLLHQDKEDKISLLHSNVELIDRKVDSELGSEPTPEVLSNYEALGGQAGH